MSRISTKSVITEFSGSRSSDVVEYQTLSSNPSHNQIERPERLHEWLKVEEIDKLYERFSRKRTLSYAELRDELEALNIQFTDIEYNRLFLKINQNHDFECDWNEFISYLMFGFQEDDPSSQKEALVLPITHLPVIRKSEHRSTICAIGLLVTASELVLEDIEGQEKVVNYDDEESMVPQSTSLNPTNTVADDDPSVLGMWITASKEGQIRFWSPNLEPLRTGMSESFHLKMQTWILCIQALSDVSVVCTSSTERELRFHEIVASTFNLRIVMRSMPFAVCCMSYSFHPHGKTNSKLLLGDFGGNVRILEYSPYLRGPFQSKPGAALIEVFWSDILKGKLPLFKCKEYINLHSEMIQGVFFSLRLNSVFAAAEYRNTRKYRGRCPGLIVVAGDDKTQFRIPLGVSTFCVDERNNIVVTGGPDTYVRIWDAYIPSEPVGLLTGHNGGIVKVFVQPDEMKVYSVDYQKVIKVWDLAEHTLLQTYTDLARLVPAETDLVYYYHPHMRILLVGGRKLISIKCNPRIRVDLTDGNTHAAPVSVILYNKLFRNMVTCGLDSYIIVWDPWTGRRKIIMKKCHTKQVYGENIDIEITAACFDPLEQFLLTGARDGSLKIWNYNNAVCIRNMSIKKEHEVTAVIWVMERILAVGWDQQVTEFNDAEGREYGDPKYWPKFHTDDITCADVKLGEGVVTATYSGELVFWKLETGQPYRRYSVTEPKKFIELKRGEAEEKSHVTNTGAHVNVSRYVRKALFNKIRKLEEQITGAHRFEGLKLKEADDIEDNIEKKGLGTSSPMSVQAVLFLHTRPMTLQHGSVFVALESGIIQVYSHHQRGGYMKEFNSIHRTGDCVLTMTSDRKNRYLFTGTAFGYIKIWHIQNYCIPESEKEHISMPLLRLQFIFLLKEKFLTRAKRFVQKQPEPMLLSSYRGHLKAINSVVYINLPKVVISASHDCSVRLWSLGGRYLGTLGTPLPWMSLSPFEPVKENEQEFRMPPDIKKVASSTTLKVITGRQSQPIKMSSGKDDEIGNSVQEDDAYHHYAKQLQEPILGKYFQLPGRSAVEQAIDLDVTASYIPVYTHLKIHEATDLERPPTPPIIQHTKNENFMDYYKSQPQRSEPNENDPITKDTINKKTRYSEMPSLFYDRVRPNENKKTKSFNMNGNPLDTGETEKRVSLVENKEILDNK